MENKFKSINSNDSVLSLNKNDKLFNECPMLTINQLISNIKYILRKFGNYDEKKIEEWFGDGISCECLEIGTNSWQKGKMRLKLTVEFCPSKPEIEENFANANQSESPLDDIRRTMNQNT